MSKKLYFRLNDGICYDVEYHREYMQEHDLKELLLIEAKREKTGYFFCKEFQAVGEIGTSNSDCKAYTPNKGISGRCKRCGYTYTYSGNMFLLRAGKKNLTTITM